jgi:hypothetical protein
MTLGGVPFQGLFIVKAYGNRRIRKGEVGPFPRPRGKARPVLSLSKGWGSFSPLLQDLRDDFDEGVRLVQHLVVPEPKHPEPERSKVIIPTGIE